MSRSYYADFIPKFRDGSEDAILGALVGQAEFSVEQTQRDAWISQIRIRFSLPQKQKIFLPSLS